MSDINFNFNSPSQVHDTPSVGKAAASFEAVGNISSGEITILTSTDGVTFTPISYYSLKAAMLKPAIVWSGDGEDRGAFDASGTTVVRFQTGPSFQGNVNISLCLDDGAQPPEKPTCCPATEAVVTSSVTHSKSGPVTIWMPPAGKRFVLMGFSVWVNPGTNGSSSPIRVSLLDNATEIVGFDVDVPSAGFASGFIPVGALGLTSAAANNPLKLSVTPSPITAGEVQVLAVLRSTF